MNILLIAYILVWVVFVGTSLLVARIDDDVRLTPGKVLFGVLTSLLWPLMVLWYGLETFIGRIMKDIATIRKYGHKLVRS